MFVGSLAHELTEAKISERLTQQAATDSSLCGGGPFRQAAVLIPFLRENGEWKILFILRSNTVPDHKGQVAFPGGGAEPEDDCVEDTALREAEEEIGLEPQNVRLLGSLASRPSNSGFCITPVIGVIRHWPFEYRLSIDEVSDVFTVPLAWLVDPAHHQERDWQLPNGHVEKVIFFDEYKGFMIWGVTGRILVRLLGVLGF